MPDSSNKIEQSLKRSKESWFGKIAGLFSKPKIEPGTWDELEELLIGADVGMATTEKLILNTKNRVKAEKLEDGNSVRNALKSEMVSLLNSANTAKNNGQAALKIVLVIGVNGSGKTTSIAKLSHEIKSGGNQVVLAAADTFRAAAIDQLKHWGEKAGVQVVAHQPGADPGAVVFDAVQAAKNRGAGVVIVDTAGRLHTKYNLMEELKKIKRVVDRAKAVQEVLLVIDATTGQNGLIQARQFSEAAGVTGIFLTKLDGTARGGIVLAISDELKIPIKYIGTGEQMDDIAPFDANSFVDAIFAG
jgi:fused signal recognition particle receptor